METRVYTVKHVTFEQEFTLYNLSHANKSVYGKMSYVDKSICGKTRGMQTRVYTLKLATFVQEFVQQEFIW